MGLYRRISRVIFVDVHHTSTYLYTPWSGRVKLASSATSSLQNEEGGRDGGAFLLGFFFFFLFFGALFAQPGLVGWVGSSQHNTRHWQWWLDR